MVIRIKLRYIRYVSYFFAVILTAIFLFLGISLTTENVLGANITNSTVIARVNVSNTEPTLYLVRVNPQPLDYFSSFPVDLTPNNTTIVVCNGSVQDINGFNDIKNVSATFYLDPSISNSLDDNNTHYSNESCGPCTAIPNSNNQNGSCICQFAVQYYANPATTWYCNMSVNDSGGLISSRNTSFVTVNEVLGISVETLSLDYGNLSASETSQFVRQNITNTGNIPINVTVRGYGSDNETIGQNVTMICEPGSAVNISFNNQRFSIKNNTAFDDMFNLTNQTRQIFNYTIPQRTEDNRLGNSSNSTFWKLQVPFGAFGVCNGTIIFGAIDAAIP